MHIQTLPPTPRKPWKALRIILTLNVFDPPERRRRGWLTRTVLNHLHCCSAAVSCLNKGLSGCEMASLLSRDQVQPELGAFYQPPCRLIQSCPPNPSPPQPHFPTFPPARPSACQPADQKLHLWPAIMCRWYGMKAPLKTKNQSLSGLTSYTPPHPLPPKKSIWAISKVILLIWQ